MFKQNIYEIERNYRIAKGIYAMVLTGADHGFTRPGQFANVKIPALYLRRPISVCDYKDGQFTIMYKTVGVGTQQMSRMKAGDKLDVITGLGNGYDTSKSGDKPLLIAGGSGVPPMYKLAKTLIEDGKRVSCALGFNTLDDVYAWDELRKLGADVFVSTVDGSYGIKGFVTDAIAAAPQDYSFFYTCGPLPMYRAIKNILQTEGQYSFEERMGCGFGACMGCSMMTKSGAKRVCKDGPIFDSFEILWEEQK
ncbi:MAG: dihydroorotate dehydrogenase electron transfer subunit [Clostridia bacterium]|nr:dihydroorotate dehydrogenase electron transfer subunit [Clostridia bacterium]